MMVLSLCLYVIIDGVTKFQSEYVLGQQCSLLRDVNHAIGQAQRDNFIEKKVLEIEKKENKPVLNALKSMFLGQKSLK